MGPIWLHTTVYKKGEENRGSLCLRCWTSAPAVHVPQLLDAERPSCRLFSPWRPQALLPSRAHPRPLPSRGFAAAGLPGGGRGETSEAQSRPGSPYMLVRPVPTGRVGASRTKPLLARTVDAWGWMGRVRVN